MKLALIRRQFSATGGAELYLQRLLQALLRGGHEPHLFAESWEGQIEGVHLHAVPVTGKRAVRATHFADAVAAELAKHSFDVTFSLERTHQQDVYRAGQDYYDEYWKDYWQRLHDKYPAKAKPSPTGL